MIFSSYNKGTEVKVSISTQLSARLGLLLSSQFSFEPIISSIQAEMSTNPIERTREKFKQQEDKLMQSSEDSLPFLVNTLSASRSYALILIRQARSLINTIKNNQKRIPYKE